MADAIDAVMFFTLMSTGILNIPYGTDFSISLWVGTALAYALSMLWGDDECGGGGGDCIGLCTEHALG